MASPSRFDDVKDNICYTKLLSFYAAAQRWNGYRRMYRSIIERLAPLLPPAGDYLDVGAGPGYFSFELAKALPEARIDALDAVPACCQRIEAGSRAGGYRIQTICKPIDELEPNHAYDVVVASGVFEHLGTDERAVTSVLRHLKADGLGVIILLPDSRLARLICWTFRAQHIASAKLLASVEALGYTWTFDESASSSVRDVFLIRHATQAAQPSRLTADHQRLG